MLYVVMVMACSSSSSSSDLPDLSVEPHHPSSNFIFPKWKFGKKKKVKRSCQYSLFQNWLHYSENEDLVFCYVCACALRSKKSS